MNRRSFIKRSLVTAAGLGMVPNIFSRTALAAGGNDKILVIFHLFGGNDAVNNVIPYTQSEYFDNRPDIAVPRNQILDLNASGFNLGLNPNLRPMMDNLWNHGELAIINSVGYPHHSRSHFHSTAIWNSGDPENIAKEGWLGPYLDEQNDPFCATSLGSSLPKALHGLHTAGLSLDDIRDFNIDNYQKSTLNSMLRDRRSGTAEEVRQALEHMLRSIDRVQNANKDAFKPGTTFPNTFYGRRFRDISRLIKADFGSQVYYVFAGGWDTHAEQGGVSGYHADLLKQVSEAVTAFKQEMVAQGKWDDVMVMLFSEFGRRIAQNASNGTDHGKGSVLYIAGGEVSGGIYGEEPSLQEEDLDDGDLRVQIDFREVYAAAAQYIGADPAELVGGEFHPIDVV